MKAATRLVLCQDLATILSILALWFSLSSANAAAQAEGNNAVYNSSGACCSGSIAFIDASVFVSPNNTQATDICDALYGLFSGRHGFPPYPASGAVVDARGITGATNLNCMNGSPWSEGTYVNVPSVILLPSGTITIHSTWVLPNATKLIGQQTTTNGPGTTIVASTPGTPSPMIQFGDSNCGSAGCTGISVQDLT